MLRISVLTLSSLNLALTTLLRFSSPSLPQTSPTDLPPPPLHVRAREPRTYTDSPMPTKFLENTCT